MKFSILIHLLSFILFSNFVSSQPLNGLKKLTVVWKKPVISVKDLKDYNDWKAKQDSLYPNTDNSVKINNYFWKLPSWISTHDLTEKKVTLSSTSSLDTLNNQNTKSGQLKLNCTTTALDVRKSPDKIVTMNPDVGKLWPGALLQGNGIEGGLGSLAEVPIRKRAPLMIALDIPSQTIAKYIENPDGTSVKIAIAELLLDAKNKNIPYANNIYFYGAKTEKLEESLFNLGFSINYMGAEAKGNLSIAKSSTQNSATFYIVQRAFSVFIVPPASPARWFSHEFTMLDLNDQLNSGTISNTNLPVYISNISYGRILIFNVVSNTSADSIIAAVSASYMGFSGSSDYKYAALLKNSSINATGLGGRLDDVVEVLRSGKILDYFNRETDILTLQPIFYQFSNLVNGTNAKFVETTKYNLKECTPLPNSAVDIGDEAYVKIEGIKVLNDCDWGITDDHLADVFGEINVDGDNAWIRNDSDQGKLDDIGNGQILNIKDHRLYFTGNESNANNEGYPEIRIDNSKKILYDDNNSDGFSINGLLGDWDPIGGYSLNQGFDVIIPYSEFKNKYNQRLRISVSSDPGSNCNMEVLYKIIKVRDIYKYVP
ncbi:MAG: thiol-activated cytolysin family protein [Saprospiraceae bacterium]|nr:thiol-activated cytolysin family protein [Saprospiraceae bacterium]